MNTGVYGAPRRAGYMVTGDQVMHVATDFESGLKFWNVVTEAYPE